MKPIVYTNKGPVRDHNEDVVFVAGNIISGCSLTAPFEVNAENSKGCCVVIDGMGGYEGGEMAARLVAMSFLDSAEGWDITAREGRTKVDNILRNAVRRIVAVADENPALSSMGAALAGVAFCSDAALIFNCGDCRVYCQNGEHLEKLSHDHSVVQELYDHGKIDEDGMRVHPRKNIVTACVSREPTFLNIYFREIPYAQEKQNFFICSDGVWEALAVNELEICLANKTNFKSAGFLVEKLLGAGEKCHDNISFLLVEIDSE